MAVAWACDISLLIVASLLLSQTYYTCAGVCHGGTQTVSADDWQSAASHAIQGGAALQSRQLSWLDWSHSWLPLGQRVLLEFDSHLKDCPEGAVTAILHSLPALDHTEGDAATLEVVKHLHHMVGDRHLSTLAGPGSLPWQQNWLLAVASLVRFVYFKWINVPHNEDSVPSSEAVAANTAMLQAHHRFLFRNTVSEFLSSGVYDLGITENSVVFSEAFAFAAFFDCMKLPWSSSQECTKASPQSSGVSSCQT
jgi:hypothetical protein